MDNIIENNKLMAEFMGFQSTSLGWFDNEEHLINVEKDNTFDDLKFHKDWNWLMGVIEKILNICAKNDDLEKYAVITDNIPYIQPTYTACIEFIKKYNNNNG